MPSGSQAHIIANAAIWTGIGGAISGIWKGPEVLINGLLLDERQHFLRPGVGVPNVVLAAVGKDLECVLVVVTPQGLLLENVSSIA
jgi:hypothetical protein